MDATDVKQPKEPDKHAQPSELSEKTKAHLLTAATPPSNGSFRKAAKTPPDRRGDGGSTSANPVPGTANGALAPSAGGTAAADASAILTAAGAAAAAASAAAAAASAPTGKRIYRLSDNKLVTRDIAALDFLLGIPLEQESDIVNAGWSLLQKQEHNDGSRSDSKARNAASYHHQQQRWWEKWIRASSAAGGPAGAASAEWGSSSLLHQVTASELLERPTREEKGTAAVRGDPAAAGTAAAPGAARNLLNYAPPGRRLEGDAAFAVKVPVTTREITTKQRSIARAAALREWELRTAHGLTSAHQPPLMDGRIFFSSGGSYPMAVFSLLRYEPRKEEAALRRQKLEARGGGGSQYVLPQRDWRGISYRALLPRTREKDHNFNRFLGTQHQHRHHRDSNDSDDDTVASDSSDDSDVYVPGLLDDPDMVLGRHRTVMVGDRVTGPIITSTIQFVEPSLLKAELNKQFRERFDGWEPPRSARRYIGARVLDGVYTLMDPGAADAADDRSTRTPRQGSVASVSTASVDTKGGGKEKQIRMPPSLTLSKIRSLKNQALTAALKANLEIGTVALACVYFERLCLDCRVDKSNRKLSMAACLLLASKINEPNIALVDAGEADNGRSGKASDAQPTAAAAGGAVSTSAATTNNSATPNTNNVAAKIQSVVRSTRRSNTMYASLLEFFTEDWSLSLKHLFAAEWGVFAALGFSLLAEPSQTAFHFRRFMKTLELNPRAYLGDEMYEQWQASLVEEEVRRQERERRRELRRQRKEQELLNLHLELENDRLRRKIEEDEDLSALGVNDDMIPVSSHAGDALHAKATDASPGKVRKPGIGFLHRLGMRRTASSEAVNLLAHSEHQPRLSTVSGAGVRRNSAKDTNGLPHSPSMPIIANVYLQNPGTFAIDFSRENPDAPSETSSIGSVGGKGTTIGSADEKEEGAIVV